MKFPPTASHRGKAVAFNLAFAEEDSVYSDLEKSLVYSVGIGVLITLEKLSLDKCRMLEISRITEYGVLHHGGEELAGHHRGKVGYFAVFVKDYAL